MPRTINIKRQTVTSFGMADKIATLKPIQVRCNSLQRLWWAHSVLGYRAFSGNTNRNLVRDRSTRGPSSAAQRSRSLSYTRVINITSHSNDRPMLITKLPESAHTMPSSRVIGDVNAASRSRAHKGAITAAPTRAYHLPAVGLAGAACL